jgi:sec-independent protein translocase protein TatC
LTTALRRPVPHDESLSLVEHLDELRSRLIVCVLALVVCFGLAFWQNERVLSIVNAPLENTQNLDGEERSGDPLEQNAKFQIRSGEKFRADQRFFADQKTLYERLATSSGASAAERRAYAAAGRPPPPPSAPPGPRPTRSRPTASDNR